MIELVLIFVMSTFTSLFLYLYLKQRKNNKAILANTLKLLLHQQQEHEANKTDKEKSNEDFLKFVSDSRDWAYQYIDDVQVSISKFITDVEPEILYFDTYGDLMAAEPNYNSMKKISASYKELRKLLPEQEDNS